jgi:hypothetical protein
MQIIVFLHSNIRRMLLIQLRSGFVALHVRVGVVRFVYHMWFLLISHGTSSLINAISKLLSEIVLNCRLTVAVGNAK